MIDVVGLFTPAEWRFRARNEIVREARALKLGPDWVKARYLELDDLMWAEFGEAAP